MGKADVVGRAIQLNGEPYTVVGVAPPGFGVASKVDAWMPMAFKPDETANDARGAHYMNVVGRLRPDVTVAQARAELELLAAQLARQYPDSNKGWGISMTPMQDYSCAMCAPSSTRCLARSAASCSLPAPTSPTSSSPARPRGIARFPFAPRSAPAAPDSFGSYLLKAFCSRWRVALAGMLLARWGLDLLLALAPSTLPRTSDIHLDAERSHLLARAQCPDRA